MKFQMKMWKLEDLLKKRETLQSLKEVSKQIRKCIRDRKRLNESLKSAEVSRTSLASNPRGRKCFFQKLKKTKRERITSRKGLANVFGEFYSKLYGSNETEEKLQNTSRHDTMAVEERINGEDNNKTIPLIIDEEIQAAINKLKKGETRDNNGIRVEEIKNCDAATKEKVKQIFNEVLKQESCTPETWRSLRITVIHKEGNEEDVGNYRPICTLPCSVHTVFDDPAQQTLSQI